MSHPCSLPFGWGASPHGPDVFRGESNDDLKEKLEELSEEEKSLRDKLEETYRDKLRAEWEIEQATKSYDSAKAEISRLKKELEKLVNGTK